MTPFPKKSSRNRIRNYKNVIDRMTNKDIKIFFKYMFKD